MKTTSSRLLCAVLLLAQVPLGLPLASAAPSAIDLESARELWREGKKLREAGKLPEALEKFRAAWALAPTPITGLDLAKTLALVGKLVEARETALTASKLPVPPNESATAQKAREEADALALSLKDRIPSLVPKVSGVDPATVKVLVDEAEVPTAALGQPRRLDPGTHVLRLVRDTTELARSSVVLAEGETREVVLTPTLAGAEPPPKVMPPPNPTPPTPIAPAPSNGIPAFGIVGLSVGVVGVAVGGVAGSSRSRASARRRTCAPRTSRARRARATTSTPLATPATSRPWASSSVGSASRCSG
ncbi:MAG: hypothetical protein IPJ34_21965 [Myxococcales bacterium]|nr:hypothetical protein [Myxococcales bacterium]